MQYFNKMNNLSISSWNVQGLGDKCKHDLFLTFLKHDMKILLETWKGTDQRYNFHEFKTFQKCRKKKKNGRGDLVEGL